MCKLAFGLVSLIPIFPGVFNTSAVESPTVKPPVNKPLPIICNSFDGAFVPISW